MWNAGTREQNYCSFLSIHIQRTILVFLQRLGTGVTVIPLVIEYPGASTHREAAYNVHSELVSPDEMVPPVCNYTLMNQVYPTRKYQTACIIAWNACRTACVVWECFYFSRYILCISGKSIYHARIYLDTWFNGIIRDLYNEQIGWRSGSDSKLSKQMMYNNE